MDLKDKIKKEGDHCSFIHTTHGINVTCIIKRNSLGSLCGYVKLEKWNRFYDSPYEDISVSVHGGLTYSDKGIIGFDCSHYGDYNPYVNDSIGTYRDMEFVKSECISLADQIMDLNRQEIRNLKISTII